MLGFPLVNAPPVAATAPVETPDPLVAYLDGMVNHGGVMLVRSIDTGQFLMVNPAFEEFVGRPACDVVGKTVHDLYSKADADAIIARDRVVLDGHVRPQLITLHNGQGELRQFLTHKFPLFDPEGQRFAVGSIAMDITSIWDDAQRSKSAQLETETRFRALFDHAPIGQIFSDVGGAVTSVNGPMAAMLGYQPEEMVGRPIRDFTPPAEYARINVATDQLLSGEAMSTSAVRRFRHRAGHEVPVRVTSALLRDNNGEPRWWVSMVVDISGEERARVELEHAHEAAVLSANRLSLLHSIATAANEAADLDVLAPRVLATVCSHFGWRGGAGHPPECHGHPRRCRAGRRHVVGADGGRDRPRRRVRRPGAAAVSRSGRAAVPLLDRAPR
jgi:PAS domain S-box-containing protein